MTAFKKVIDALDPDELRSLVEEIVEAMDGKMWDADTHMAVADALARQGIQLREPDDESAKHWEITQLPEHGLPILRGAVKAWKAASQRLFELNKEL